MAFSLNIFLDVQKLKSHSEDLSLTVEYYHLKRLYISSFNSVNMRHWGKRIKKEALSPPVWQNTEYVEPKTEWDN